MPAIKRIKVTDPHTGVTVTVREGSKQALLWGSRSSVSLAPNESWTVADLKAYASENGIDLFDSTKKADILAAIELHVADIAPADDGGEESE